MGSVAHFDAVASPSSSIKFNQLDTGMKIWCMNFGRVINITFHNNCSFFVCPKVSIILHVQPPTGSVTRATYNSTPNFQIVFLFQDCLS